jgi:hypothetical protein
VSSRKTLIASHFHTHAQAFWTNRRSIADEQTRHDRPCLVAESTASLTVILDEGTEGKGGSLPDHGFE